MVDYSRFDKIDMGSDDEEVEEQHVKMDDMTVDNEDEKALAEKVSQNTLPIKSTKKTSKTKEGRIAFKYDGRTIYEWEQSLEECNIYITPPAGLPRELIDIRITYDHLVVGVKDTTPFIGMYLLMKNCWISLFSLI